MTLDEKKIIARWIDNGMKYRAVNELYQKHHGRPLAERTFYNIKIWLLNCYNQSRLV